MRCRKQRKGGNICVLIMFNLTAMKSSDPVDLLCVQSILQRRKVCLNRKCKSQQLVEL